MLLLLGEQVRVHARRGAADQKWGTERGSVVGGGARRRRDPGRTMDERRETWLIERVGVGGQEGRGVHE